MSSVREEILRISIEKLQNKVESIMLTVNIILSNPEKTNCVVVDRIADLMIELSTIEGALNHAKTLHNQCITLSERIKEIQESVEKNSIEHKQSEK